MSWLVAAPVLVPALAAALLVLTGPGRFARAVLVAVPAVLLFLAALLVDKTGTGWIGTHAAGNWPLPFGIVLVADRLSALMLGIVAFVALAAALHSVAGGWDMRGRHFHALFLFQLFGINGAVLTGDAFNLFVFFEVLLISSYALAVHGGGGARIRAGLPYVLINLVGSAVFLIALGTLYSVTGTLNMADMALRAQAVGPGEQSLLRLGAAMILSVFLLKAALVPFHFWLPATYAQAPGPVAALFVLLTKVGAYAFLRMGGLVFGPAEATGDMLGWILLPAIATLILGAAGLLGETAGRGRLGTLAAFALVWSMGTLLAALSFADARTTAAALYYLIHASLAGALLFLVIDLVTGVRTQGDLLAPGPDFAGRRGIGLLFLLAAVAVAGLPPMPGFAGKLMILDATRGEWPLWTAILATSLAAMLAFARAGSVVFWTSAPEAGRPPPLRPAAGPGLAACLPAILLVAGLASLTILAAPVTAWLEAAAAGIHDPAPLIAAVLGDPT